MLRWPLVSGMSNWKHENGIASMEIPIIIAAMLIVTPRTEGEGSELVSYMLRDGTGERTVCNIQ